MVVRLRPPTVPVLFILPPLITSAETLSSLLCMKSGGGNLNRNWILATAPGRGCLAMYSGTLLQDGDCRVKFVSVNFVAHKTRPTFFGPIDLCVCPFLAYYIFTPEPLGAYIGVAENDRLKGEKFWSLNCEGAWILIRESRRDWLCVLSFAFFLLTLSYPLSLPLCLPLPLFLCLSSSPSPFVFLSLSLPFPNCLFSGALTISGLLYCFGTFVSNCKTVLLFLAR